MVLEGRGQVNQQLTDLWDVMEFAPRLALCRKARVREALANQPWARIKASHRAALQVAASHIP